jgi:3-oxoacyl-[acyl-carrier protein] reductase
LLVKCDISKPSEVKKLIEKTIQTFGKIDVLVNNAGIHLDGKVSNLDEYSWNKVINTNLNGTFHCCKYTLSQMKKQKYGRIINMSSFTALVGAAGASNYAASKAGIIAFSKSLAKEIASYGITVNTIAPGYFDIGMFYDLDQPTIKKIISKIPAKRLGEPKEIFELITLIISSPYLTGREFVIDGGFSL